MATGDNERTAQAVAGKRGIDEVRAAFLPEAKKDLIDPLRLDGHKIATAGDGVNDAPALAATDVGIAMGKGAGVAMDSAGPVRPRGLEVVLGADGSSAEVSDPIELEVTRAIMQSAVPC